MGIKILNIRSAGEVGLIFSSLWKMVENQNRRYSPFLKHIARQETIFRYLRDTNVNTLRLEGKFEDDHFFELAD
jgi:hypothetical protein